MECDRASRTPGIVQVYTGNGKGKTTAAWGQALRAMGHGMNVCIVRFLKSASSGEVKAAERFRANLSVLGRTSPYDATIDQRGSQQLRDETQANFLLAVALIESGEYDLIVLDEINNAMDYGFVSASEMLSVMARRPPHVSLVLTGRYSPPAIVDASDLVTEMIDVKHPFADGGNARRGIEY